MKKKPSELEKMKLKELVFARPPEFKKLSCPACAAPIEAEGINIQDKLAKCQSCAAIFSFEEAATSLMPKPVMKQEVIRPEGIDVFHFRHALDITINQPVLPLEAVALGMVPFFTVLFTFLSIEKGAPIILPTIGWMLTLLLIWIFSTRSKQKIHITVEDGYLSLIWRPRKMQRIRRYRTEDIDQIYVSNRTGLNSVYMIFNGENGQKHIKLIGNIDSLSKARYLEQELEAYLGIEDRSIPEETK